MKTSKTKESILSKIRHGLSKGKVPIPFPEIEKNNQDIFNRPTGFLEETFASAFIQLGGHFMFCNDENELFDSLQQLINAKGWQQIVCAEDAIAKELDQLLEHVTISPQDALETAQVSITLCEALIARTGSILISSHQNYGRTTPVFYPAHIVVARTSQVLEDIEHGLDWLLKKYQNNLPSMINLNTGPSRTADIEKTLVVGVHGPKEVFCFLINQ